MPPPEPTGDHVDLLLDRFEADWRAGRRPSVEQYLRECTGPEALRLVRELVCLDVIYRRLAGEPADPAEYAGRVPEFAQLPPADRAELAGDVERSAPAVVPVRIGKYRVLAKLADGGQAVTYRAYHEELHKPVVVKHARRPADPGGTPEGQMLAALAHPNIVRIYDADVHDGRPFVVLEDIPGRTLAEYAAAERPGPRRAAELVAGAARGLGEAHRHGIAHLDVTAGNVVVDADDRPRVIDFGLARRVGWASVEEAAAGGTLEYMAPEQANGDGRLDCRTDVFGLGAVLYRLLTGRPPYAGDTPAAVWSKAKARDLDEAALSAPGVPARLRRVCLKALAAAPAARYPNADALAAELERFLRPWPWWRTLLLWAAILAAAVAVGWAVGQWNRAAPPGPSGLDVMVYREKGEGYRPLAGSLPVKAGARVQVRVRVPAGTHATLFLLHGRGELRRLAEYPAADAVREEVYPGAGKVVPLTGSAGTGFFFVVGSRGGPVTDEQIRGLWAGAELPALPTDSVVRVDSDRVRLEVGDRPRDVGAPEAVADPAEQVQQRLEEFRGRLRAAGVVYCDGLAFGHPGGEGGP